MINIKSEREIELMKKAGNIVFNSPIFKVLSETRNYN